VGGTALGAGMIVAGGAPVAVQPYQIFTQGDKLWATRGVVQLSRAETLSLQRLFGQSIRGVQNALRRTELPPGLTREALMKYRDIAVRAVRSGNNAELQSLRIKLVDKVLAMMGG